MVPCLSPDVVFREAQARRSVIPEIEPAAAHRFSHGFGWRSLHSGKNCCWLAGTAVEVARLRFGSRIGARLAGYKSAPLYRLSGAPRDPLVLAGVVVAMLLLGAIATWVPAQRALSINPLLLLREE